MMDQTQEQWLAYFDSGQRYEIPYTLDAVRKFEQDMLVSRLASSAAILDSPLTAVATGGANALLYAMSQSANAAFFGTDTTPSFGISNHGLHLPTVPLIRWDDIVLILFNNFRGTWHRAANARMVAEPQVGSPGSKGPMDGRILVRNGPMILSTIDPRSAHVLSLKPTPRGQQWGSIDVRLDPGLGQEQIVELVYLVGIMAAARKVTIEHTGGYFGDMRSFDAEDRIIALN